MARNKTYFERGGGNYIIANIDVDVEKFNPNDTLFL